MTDLGGQIAVITGGNSGIGKETAAALAGMGAHVVIAARNPAKAAAAVQELGRRAPEATVEHLPLDLASFAVGARVRRHVQRAVRPPRRARQQRGRVAPQAHGDRGRPRDAVPGEPPQPLPADRAPAGTPGGRARGPGDQRLVDRAHGPPPRPRLRRSRLAVPQVPRLHRLRPHQARQRAVHPRARAPRRRQWDHRQRGAPGLGRARTSAAKATWDRSSAWR